MIIRLLPNHEETILEAATWLHMEWIKENAEESLDRVIEVLSGRVEKDSIPLTIIAQTNEGKLIGLASLTAVDDKDPGHGPWLSDLYVSTHFREHGVGHSLCRKIADIAKQLGHQELFLFTKKNQDLIHLYESLGYYQISEREIDGQDLLVMKIIL